MAYINDEVVVACSKTGCDYASTADYVFKRMSGNEGEGYYSISVSPSGNTAFASGPDGKLAKLVWESR